MPIIYKILVHQARKLQKYIKKIYVQNEALR
jgi:hypothetical protein